jgi:hypothetical protein
MQPSLQKKASICMHNACSTTPANYTVPILSMGSIIGGEFVLKYGTQPIAEPQTAHNRVGRVSPGRFTNTKHLFLLASEFSYTNRLCASRAGSARGCNSCAVCNATTSSPIAKGTQDAKNIEHLSRSFFSSGERNSISSGKVSCSRRSATPNTMRIRISCCCTQAVLTSWLVALCSTLWWSTLPSAVLQPDACSPVHEASLNHAARLTRMRCPLSSQATLDIALKKPCIHCFDALTQDRIASSALVLQI